MIYITGDCHSDFSRFNKENFPEQKEMTKDDVVIICGDFGGVWNVDEESKRETWWLDWLEERSFTTLFVDGNHENFDRLYDYPVKEWHGGKVHVIRPSVLHLMRGEVFDVCEKKIFAFGGASSHDISDGILDSDDEDWEIKAKKLDSKGKYMYRIKGLSWWPEELPSEEEMKNGVMNLTDHNNKVDFVVSHSPAASTVALLGHGLYSQDVLTRYLEDLRSTLDYKIWFFGHMHINKNVNSKEIGLYEQIIRIA